MKISLFGKSFQDNAVSYLTHLFDLIHAHNIHASVYEPYAQYLAKKKVETGIVNTYSQPHELEDTNVMVCIGGDGTLLEAVTLIGNKNIPIMGINTGRLGFLTTTPKHMIASDFEKLLHNKYTIDKRTLIRIDTDADYFEGVNFGLNEFSILKKDTSSMIIVHTYLNESFLNSYWADGLIMATPTGSTAYSLSCGGPVVMPNSSTFVITPISPHNLNVRPLIINDDSVLTFRIESRSKNFMISLDSRYKTVGAQVQITARKADFHINLIEIENHTFLDTLREKLYWGIDKRN
ncbi:MAG: NAD kinase [Cytophagales bacterium]|nr:NAD kinase [Cytophagales bacterium]